VAVLLDKHTRLIVQGLTGREGTFHAKAAAAYGTQVVGGVTPGKGGTTHEGWPIFNSVHDAVRETGADAIGLDETVDPLWANAQLPEGLPVQGNLDPLALIAGGERLDDAIDSILAAFSSRPHIFNLGHGILLDTPLAHVERLIARVRR